jgi:hypothetical protein
MGRNTAEAGLPIPEKELDSLHTEIQNFIRNNPGILRGATILLSRERNDQSSWFNVVLLSDKLSQERLDAYVGHGLPVTWKGHEINYQIVSNIILDIR